MSSAWKPIDQIAKEIQSGQIRAADLVEKALKTIDEHKEFEAIIATTTERARARAKAIDERVSKGEKVGRLAGVPFIAKDNFLAFGAETTAASNILKGFNAPYQATAIEKLEAEGAICVAKANLDAFGHGSSTENSDFMITKNPHDKTRVPGGSSGGSAAAVMLDMAPFALGTDTGSSIRLPAAFCGAFGLKPTYGLVSRNGVIAMGSSLDTIGAIAKSADDLGLIFDVMAGKDELDGTTVERDPGGYQLTAGYSVKGKKFGLIKEYLGEGLDKDVKARILEAADKLKQSGAEVTEVSLPSLPLSLAVYYIICPAEISSNLSRYDGQKYGYTDPAAQDLEQSYNLSRTKGFGREAKRRIIIGTYVLSSGYYDAYYKKAQQLRTKLIEEYKAVFDQVDFLIGPVAPFLPFKIGERSGDPLQMYLADAMMVGANLAGIPAISVPAGMIDGLPVGLQLMAPQRQDRELLALAKKTEELINA